MQDPQFIDVAVWSGISRLLMWLWVFVPFAIGAGVCFLVAHAAIPSLVSSGHLSRQAERARPVLYLVAFAALVVAIVSMALIGGAAGVIADVFDRWWI